MNNVRVLAKLLVLAEELGAVERAHLYENGLVTVEGTRARGGGFCLSFSAEVEDRG